MPQSKLKPIYIACILIFAGLQLFSQSLRDNMRFGEAAFNDGDYYSAAYYFSKAIEQEPENIQTAYLLAEASRLSHAYKDAERWYKFVKQRSSVNIYPLLDFQLGSVKKSLGKYDKALGLFTSFYEANKQDSSFIVSKAKQEIASCVFAQKLMQDTLKIRISPLEQTINTPYSEFNPYPISDTALYFSTLRPTAKEKPNVLIPPTYTTTIYKSTLSIGGWSEPQALDNRINSRDAHNANICFNPERNVMYFSRCFEESPIRMICDLYKSKSENNRWSNPEKLGEHINLQGYTSTQPSYGRIDGLNDVLFFVSDRPGGQGGLDIWYSIINNDVYGEPINLGSFVNTPGNEITPFFHIPTQTLYFSSDWIEGLGGYDIFKTKGYFNTWEKPQNLGFPINTSYNDTYFVMNEEFPEAFLTSNRPGSLYLKGETCCNDIFYIRFDELPKDTIVEEIAEELIEETDIEAVINELLPLTLYFHNDEPDPATTITRSQRNYKETLEAYMALKDIYVREYSSGLRGADKAQAQSDISDFFDTYVMGGFEKLEKFTTWLTEDLEAGNTVQITIRGYCSPLNTSRYNISLSKRRISSLINFIKKYDNGRLIPYMNNTAENGGRLEIYEEPLGDREASPFVSNNPHDVRNSIYSRAAALERKVEIIQYTSGKDSSDMVFPEITFSSTSHNFGTTEKGERKVHILRFRNTGKASLFITSVETTSAALVTDWKVREIKPGGSGVINLLFDARNIQGLFNEYIYVTGNTNQGKIALEIKAEVKE